jgi:hypothetical protein
MEFKLVSLILVFYIIASPIPFNQPRLVLNMQEASQGGATLDFSLTAEVSSVPWSGVTQEEQHRLSRCCWLSS